MPIFTDISHAIKRITSPFEEPRRRAQEHAAAHPEVLPKKIETPSQLHARYVFLLVERERRGYGWQELNENWLGIIFDKFADQNGHWTHDSPANYLDAVLPPSTPEVKALWIPCISLLHNVLLRLGNYPFLADPVIEHVTFDVFRCAVLHIIYREHELSQRWPERTAQDLSARFPRLLFQSLMTPSYVQAVDLSGRIRLQADDEYIDEVLELVERRNRWRHHEDPKFSHSGPDLPTPNMFPCGWSSKVSGSIPHSEMLKLVKLLLALQLSPENVGPEALSDDANGQEEITRHITFAFHGTVQMNTSPDVIWDTFDSTLRDALPNLLFSFDRLFRCIARPRMLINNVDVLRSADITTATTILQAMFSAPVDMQGSRRPRYQEANLHRLAQLSTFLPMNLRLMSHERTCIPVTDITPASIEKKLDAAKSSPIVLLLSGTSEAEQGLQRVCFGAYLPPYNAQSVSNTEGLVSKIPPMPMIFQLEPIHRIWKTCAGHPKASYSLPAPNMRPVDQNLGIAIIIDDEGMHEVSLNIGGNGVAAISIDKLRGQTVEAPSQQEISGNKMSNDGSTCKEEHESWEYYMKDVEILRF